MATLEHTFSGCTWTDSPCASPTQELVPLPGSAASGELFALLPSLKIPSDNVGHVLQLSRASPALDAAVWSSCATAVEGSCIDPKQLIGGSSTEPFLTTAELAKLLPQAQLVDCASNVRDEPTEALSSTTAGNDATPAEQQHQAFSVPSRETKASGSRCNAPNPVGPTRRSTRVVAHAPPPAPASASAHVCPTCYKSFSGAHALRRHRKTHRLSTLTCGVCGYSPKGSRVSSLERHQRGRATCLALQRQCTDEQLVAMGCITWAVRGLPCHILKN